MREITPLFSAKIDSNNFNQPKGERIMAKRNQRKTRDRWDIMTNLGYG